MERVIQEDATGCGLACVAMVAEVTYAEVRQVAVDVLGFDLMGPFYTDHHEVRWMLAEFGYALSRYTPFKSYSPISPLSLLEIEKAGGCNHWVLLVKHALDMYLLDPAEHIKKAKRRDWHRLKVVGYMNIRCA